MGISRHIAMQDLPPVVADDEKAVQNSKRERWDGEEIHGRNGLAMVSEERQPALHGIWISRSSPDPSPDTPFRELETQLEQFAVNARCSPGRILGNHTENQGADLFEMTRFRPPTCLNLETHGRGRDVSCLTPPARIRTGALTHTALTADVWRRSAGWDRDEGWQVGESSDPQERRGEAK